MALADHLSRRNIFIALAAVAALFLYIFVGGEEGSSANLSYRTKTVDAGNIFRSVAASGSVNAVIEVDVGSQLSGQIKEIYADFNDAVTEGEMIALLDPEMFEMRLGQSEAVLAVSNADLSSRRAQLSSDKSAAELLDREVARQERLFKNGNLSASAIDTVKTNAKQAAQRVAMSEAAVLNAEAVVLQRRSSVKQAQIELSRTQIRAPINGVVIERAVDVGQTVAASMSAPILFRLANDLRDVRVEASIDEADIGQVKADQPVKFTVDAYPDRNFTGTVEEVRLAPVIAQNVVTYTVTILASNNDMALLPGMTANVEVVTGERSDVVRVSNDVLRFKPRNGEDAEANTGGAGGGGGGRPSTEAMVARMVAPLAKDIGMSAEQVDSVREGLGEALKQAMASARESGNFRGAMQKVTSKMAGLVEEVGTAEQIAAYKEMVKAQASNRQARAGRRASLWALDGEGKAVKRNVSLGISDSDFTEVLRGLKAGDEVIFGYERAAR